MEIALGVAEISMGAADATDAVAGRRMCAPSSAEWVAAEWGVLGEEEADVARRSSVVCEAAACRGAGTGRREVTQSFAGGRSPRERALSPQSGYTVAAAPQVESFAGG